MAYIPSVSGTLSDTGVYRHLLCVVFSVFRFKRLTDNYILPTLTEVENKAGGWLVRETFVLHISGLTFRSYYFLASRPWIQTVWACALTFPVLHSWVSVIGAGRNGVRTN